MIRKYEAQDVESIISTFYKASLLAHPFLAHSFLEKEKQNIREIYLPNTETWVYEIEHKVVGFIAMMGNEVGAIFLDPAYHGRGIGYQLMEHVSQLYKVLEVEVFKQNSIGRAFYKKFGFEYLTESLHEETNCEILRLKYTRKN